MQSFVNFRDKFGSELFARTLSESVFVCALDGTNPASLTVPEGAAFCVIGGANFWVSKTGNPSLPAINTFTPSNAEYEASVINVENITTLYFMADSASKISVGFYK